MPATVDTVADERVRHRPSATTIWFHLVLCVYDELGAINISKGGVHRVSITENGHNREVKGSYGDMQNDSVQADCLQLVLSLKRA